MNRLKAPLPQQLPSPASGEGSASPGATNDAPGTPPNWLSSALAVWVRPDTHESDNGVHKIALHVHTAH